MLSLTTEHDLLTAAAAAVRDRRASLNWRQIDLAERSGVAVATVRRFERTGVIALPGFAKLAATLGLADDLVAVLKKRPTQATSVEEFVKAPAKRQRIRRPKA
ncbi:MAG TPA: helix-turn-helix transcriptional regulator [Opitutaceae bacterium]|nr:helix-turn-helix transcriptional regulator [Opitutaceae bacterium]